MPRATPENPFVSYAQNFEDVILNRALQDIDVGCYIDVGAHDPVICNVSLGFYAYGWRGVHVEPSPKKAAALRAARPDELVLQSAVTSAVGPITFYEFDASSSGLNTGDEKILEQHSKGGLSFNAISVDTVTLDEVFAQAQCADIHWLKIDVEGMEGDVLESWTGAARPWILVIEATEPGKPIQTHAKWEPKVLQLGYTFVYFDGLNRFYLHQDHLERAKHFGPGPNVFDYFVFGENEGMVGAWALGHKLKEGKKKISQLENEVQALRSLLQSGNAKARRLGKRAQINIGQKASQNVATGATRRQSPAKNIARWLIANEASKRYATARSTAKLALSLLRKHKGLHTLITAKIAKTPALQRLAHHLLSSQAVTSEGHAAISTNRQLADHRLRVAANTLPQKSLARGRTTPRSKPRLAFVTPLPPDQSGVADYSAALLPYLARYYDIDGVVQCDAEAIALVDGLQRVITSHDFRACAYDYDRIVYNFGNAHFHSSVFELCRDFPGILLMHGTHLGEITLALEAEPGGHGFANNALWEEGGYKAIQQRYSQNGASKVCARYPMLFATAKSALGVLTTNHDAQQGLRRLWRDTPDIPMDEVQLSRQRPATIDKAAARERLGIAQEAFIICSYGHLVPTKGAQAVLDAFVAADLPANAARLIFVGGCPQGLAQPKLDAAAGRASITGYVDQACYQDYLAAADMAVQLRTSSRGETSGTVLDALAYGLPTVINAHGSLAEVPDDIIEKLPGHFDIMELARAIRRLYDDDAYRHNLGQKAGQYIEKEYNPSKVAALYHQKIENLVKRARPENSIENIRDLASKSLRGKLSEKAITKASKTLVQGRTFPVTARRLLFDVSGIALHDGRTGIQRTLRAQLLALSASPPPGFRIEPVRLVATASGVKLLFARQFAAEVLGLGDIHLPDLPVDLHPGDVYFGADFDPITVTLAAQQGLYQAMREKGLAVYFSVYDLLPIKHPNYFPPHMQPAHSAWLRAIAECSDGLICISKSVMQDTRAWLEQYPGLAANLRLEAAPLGSEIAQSQPTTGLPDGAPTLLKTITSKQTFLAVGSVCPRRGYEQLLEAFELLWSEGQDVNLVIVGSALWPDLKASDRRTVPEIEAALEACSQRNEQLIWLQGVSDEYLQALYNTADVFVTATRAEGFGLPLVEAAAHGLPIIARDIPVFREIAGDESAFYFTDATAEGLAQAIRDWQGLHAKGEHPCSNGIQGYTWDNNRKALLAAMGLDGAEQRKHSAPKACDCALVEKALPARPASALWSTLEARQPQ